MRRSSRSSRASRTSRRCRQEEARCRSDDDRTEFYQQVEKKVLGPLTDAMRIKQKLESYGRSMPCSNDLLASLPEDDASSGRMRAHLPRAAGKGDA